MSIKDVAFGATKLPIKKFNISEMADHCTIAIIAKRGTGKSFLTREIMYIKRHIACCIAISRTEKLNCFYGDFIPQSYIYSEYTSDILTKVYSRQSKMNEDNMIRKRKGREAKNDSLMLIMDDCMSSKGTWLKDPNIQELFFNGRHHHLSFILTMQYAMGIPPEYRSNFDYVFLLAEDNVANRKRLYDQYAGMFPSFDIFQQVFTDVTDNYGMLVINNKIHSKDITNKVFWYKAAKSIPEFTVGSKKYIKYHKTKYDPEWNKRLTTFDPSTLLKGKKNNIRVSVVKVR